MSKKWTPEERQAFAEKMAASRAAKKQPNTKTEKTNQATITQEQYQELLAKLNKLENERLQPDANPAQPSISSAGRVQGVVEKYSTNRGLYLDQNPINRLLEEKELSRFNLKENYALYWSIDTTRYQTATGVWMSEPRFRLEVRRKDLDEEGNNKREIVLGVQYLHEDYDAAVSLAQTLGLPVDENMGKDFIDEMRYQQWRMFVKELFFPPKSISPSNRGKKEVVVGGRVVTIYENPKDMDRDLEG